MQKIIKKFKEHIHITYMSITNKKWTYAQISPKKQQLGKASQGDPTYRAPGLRRARSQNILGLWHTNPQKTYAKRGRTSSRNLKHFLSGYLWYHPCSSRNWKPLKHFAQGVPTPAAMANKAKKIWLAECALSLGGHPSRWWMGRSAQQRGLLIYGDLSRIHPCYGNCWYIVQIVHVFGVDTASLQLNSWEWCYWRWCVNVDWQQSDTMRKNDKYRQ